MMKRLGVFFCLLFLQMVSVAEPLPYGPYQIYDGCIENGKYKSKFTIDRRCYVTPEQKKQSPYNATVALLNKYGEVYCSGTIFRDNQNDTTLAKGLYLYTAAHCVPDKPETKKIRLQDGSEMFVEKVNVSSHVDKYSDNNGDWAVYKIPESEQNVLPFVDIGYGIDPASSQLNVVGHGGLAIMSDENIRAIKEDYVAFLIEFIYTKLTTDPVFVANYEMQSAGFSKEEEDRYFSDILEQAEQHPETTNLNKDYLVLYPKEELKKAGLPTGGYNPFINYFDGVLTKNTDGFYNAIPRVKKIKGFFAEFLLDTQRSRIIDDQDSLKYSVCNINSATNFCQIYGGNSGGGIFNENGDKIKEDQ